MPRILISTDKPREAHVVFERSDEERLDAYVSERAPGWWVDWNEPQVSVGRTRFKLPLQRSVGRPSRAGVPTGKITIRATEAERDAWTRAAKGRPLGEWIRESCNAATKARS